MKKSKFKVHCIGYALAGAELAGFLFFYLYPLVISIMKSLSGSVNQYEALFQTDAFLLAVSNTFKFIGAGLPLLSLISIVTAVRMYQVFSEKKRRGTLFMTLHLLPMIMPSAVIAFLVKTVFALNTSRVFILLLLIYLWKNYGYCMVIVFSGIQRVKKEEFEAARLDGAGEITIFRKVVFPQIKSYLLFAVMMGIIGLFKIFRESYMLFGNYPPKSVYMLQNFMNNCFYTLNYNKLAAASAVVLAFLSLIVAGMLWKNSQWQGA